MGVHERVIDAARRAAVAGCVFALAVTVLSVGSPAYAEDASDHCITTGELDPLWFGEGPDPTPWPADVWNPRDGDAVYLPIVDYRTVPIETRLDAPNPCQDPSTLANFDLPFLVRQGAGAGFVVLDGDLFGCTDEPICDFYYAGKRYNLRDPAIIKSLSCANRPYVAALPARPYAGWNGTRVVRWVTRMWAKKDSLCMPVPKRPGTYRVFFDARKKGVPGKDTYAYKCIYTTITNEYRCDWYLDGEVGGSIGRKFTFQRDIVVTDDAVALRKA